MSKPFLSVIIPIQHEGEEILDSLLSLDYMLSLSEFSYECLLIYMNASIESKRVCEKFSTLVKYIDIAELKEKDRWGGFITEGLRLTKGNLRMFIDSGSIPVFTEREKIIQKMRDGYECVIATSENVLEGEYNIPKSIPYMVVIKEDLIPIIEKEYGSFHTHRVLFAEIVGFFLKNNIKTYVLPSEKKNYSKKRETVIDKIVHTKRLLALKREHKKRLKNK